MIFLLRLRKPVGTHVFPMFNAKFRTVFNNYQSKSHYFYNFLSICLLFHIYIKISIVFNLIVRNMVKLDARIVLIFKGIFKMY